MRKFIREIHQEQFLFVQKYTAEIMSQVPPELAGLRSHLYNHESVADFVKKELEAALLYSVRAYTDWLATKLVRSKNFNKQPVPSYTKEELAIIAEMAEVGTGFIQSFVVRLTRPGTVLPLVGKIEADGQLVPDKAALEEWATFFNWGE